MYIYQSKKKNKGFVLKSEIIELFGVPIPNFKQKSRKPTPHEHYIISRPEVVTLISINRSRKRFELIYLISIYIKVSGRPIDINCNAI